MQQGAGQAQEGLGAVADDGRGAAVELFLDFPGAKKVVEAIAREQEQIARRHLQGLQLGAGVQAAAAPHHSGRVVGRDMAGRQFAQLGVGLVSREGQEPAFGFAPLPNAAISNVHCVPTSIVFCPDCRHRGGSALVGVEADGVLYGGVQRLEIELAGRRGCAIEGGDLAGDVAASAAGYAVAHGAGDAAFGLHAVGQVVFANLAVHVVPQAGEAYARHGPGVVAGAGAGEVGRGPWGGRGAGVVDEGLLLHGVVFLVLKPVRAGWLCSGR